MARYVTHLFASAETRAAFDAGAAWVNDSAVEWDSEYEVVTPADGTRLFACVYQDEDGSEDATIDHREAIEHDAERAAIR